VTPLGVIFDGFVFDLVSAVVMVRYAAREADGRGFS
jgi:hypothetical protein